jgi:putative oxidoreductase
MTTLDSFYAAWTPRLLSVLRIVAAFLFIAHGTQKLFGFLTPTGAAAPPAFSQMWVGGVLEFVTRPVAFILSGMMAVGYFQMHAPAGFWLLQNKGELAAVYCFLFLFLSVAGGGSWSVARLLRRSVSEAQPLPLDEAVRKAA